MDSDEDGDGSPRPGGAVFLDSDEELYGRHARRAADADDDDVDDPTAAAVDVAVSLRMRRPYGTRAFSAAHYALGRTDRHVRTGTFLEPGRRVRVSRRNHGKLLPNGGHVPPPPVFDAGLRLHSADRGDDADADASGAAAWPSSIGARRVVPLVTQSASPARRKKRSVPADAANEDDGDDGDDDDDGDAVPEGPFSDRDVAAVGTGDPDAARLAHVLDHADWTTAVLALLPTPGAATDATRITPNAAATLSTVAKHVAHRECCAVASAWRFAKRGKLATPLAPL